MRRGAFGVVGIVLCMVAAVTTARAANGRDPKDEQPIWDGLKRIDASLVGTFRAATEALDAGRFDDARAGFTAVLGRVPEHAASLRRLSYVEVAQKHPAEALALARRALAAEPGSDGTVAVAGAMLASNDPDQLAEA